MYIYIYIYININGIQLPEQDQQTRELISAQDNTHRHNDKDPSCLWLLSPGMQVNTRYINSTDCNWASGELGCNYAIQVQNLCQVQKLLSYQSFAICTSKNKHIHVCECKSNKWFPKTGSDKENPCLRSLRTNYCTSLEHQLCIRYVAKLHTDINHTDTHNKSFILANTGACYNAMQVWF